MSIERERKFLVDPSKLPSLPTGRVITAGYFTKEEVAIRVTIRGDGVQKICFKSPGGLERQEFEYKIPADDASALMKLAPTNLTKMRYDLDGWEIDEFLSIPPVFILKGAMGRLWMAEYEEAPNKPLLMDPLPAWAWKEVTDNPAYSNQHLAWRWGNKEGRWLAARIAL